MHYEYPNLVCLRPLSQLYIVYIYLYITEVCLIRQSASHYIYINIMHIFLCIYKFYSTRHRPCKTTIIPLPQGVVVRKNHSSAIGAWWSTNSNTDRMLDTTKSRKHKLFILLCLLFLFSCTFHFSIRCLSVSLQSYIFAIRFNINLRCSCVYFFSVIPFFCIIIRLWCYNTCS